MSTDTNPPRASALPARLLGITAIALALSTYHFINQTHQRELQLLDNQHTLERQTERHEHERRSLEHHLSAEQERAAALQRARDTLEREALRLDAALTLALAEADALQHALLAAHTHANHTSAATTPPSDTIDALTRAEIDDLTTQLAHAQATIEALTAERGDILSANAYLHAYSVETEQRLAELERENDTLRADAQRLALQPPPPAPNITTPLPPPNPYSDTVLDITLEAYLSELLRVIANDATAANVRTDHPMSVLYRDELEIITQGELGRHSPYRVTERYAFNEFGDILQRGLILIDAPAGAPTATLVQQTLSSVFGAPSRDESNTHVWFADNKRFTLHQRPDTPQRLTLAVEDTYTTNATMQIFGRD